MLRDINSVNLDLIVSDLEQIEKRMERLEKDLKKMRSPDLEKEFELLKRSNAQLEAEKPLRSHESTLLSECLFRGELTVVRGSPCSTDLLAAPPQRREFAEDEILSGFRLLGRAGLNAEPTSAVVIPALAKLPLPRDESVLIILTGSGLKSTMSSH